MLVAHTLSKSFANVEAVKSVSLTIEEGEIVALLGPNGAGKTTTLRMLIGLTPMDTGSIKYVDADGQTRHTLPPKEIGYLPEERGLYIDRTVLDGLIYFARLRGYSHQAALTSAESWLRRFDLWDRRDDQVKTLSKGNQQKVQFISAVIHEPRLAIIDEPFSGFDPINQERMLTFLDELRTQGTAILFSAHQMDLVQRLADRIVLLSRGSVVEQGSFEDIRQRAGGGSAIEAEFENVPDAKAIDDSPWPCTLDGHRLRIVPGNQQTINDAMGWLAGLGAIRSLEAKEVSLHEIYLDQLQEKPQ